MKNTSVQATFRMLVYRSGHRFVGICYETGLVEIWPTMEETRTHLHDGSVALMKSVEKGDAPETVINRKPAFKERVLFAILPLVWGLSRLSSVSLFTEPINPLALRHA